ncbi:glycerophosphoryl diester phosphodiesterase membrane domain-containing protein [Georgenia sp. MJ206]|uniref:glycerophosphoryl diester phosphodiesterase membrane domain-containing protein n=1 Tax=Georgenia wangjunii TaxID=3117730 RepID=UPI002F261966
MSQRPEDEGTRGQDDAPRYGRYGAPQDNAGGTPQYGQSGQNSQYGQSGQSGQNSQYNQYNQYGQYGPPQEGGVPPAPPAPQHGRPEYGQHGTPPAPPGSPAAQYGQYGAPAGGGYYGPGFAQVPAAVQPGIIPLRPLTLGEIYDGAFRAIRTNPAVMFGLSAIVVGVSTLIELALIGTFLSDLETFVLSGSTDFEGVVNAGSLAGVLLAALATSFATVILTGLLILSVSDSVLGRKISIGGVWQRARGQMWRLVGLTLLLGVGGTVAGFAAILLFVGIVAGLAAVSGDLVVLGVLLGLVVFIGLGLVLAWLGVRTMLASPAIMLERTGVLASIARSWRLSRRSFWRLLGIMLLTLVLLAVLQGILSVPFTIVGTIIGGTTSPTWPLILQFLGQAIGSAVAIPFVSAVLALLYIDVRMRREALDVELARAAQGG